MVMTTINITVPKTVSTAITTKMVDTSTIAKLSSQVPQLFADDTVLVFDGASEAEIVGENAKKSSYDQPIRSRTAKRVKIQTTTRVSSELKWADEDNRHQIIQRIQEDQASALGRALDYIVYHGINPKTGEKAADLTDTIVSGVTNPVAPSKDASADLDALISMINENYEVNGIALSKGFANSLRKIRVAGTGMRLYPDIPLNLNMSTLKGVNAVTSSTVNGAKAKTATNVLAIAGIVEKAVRDKLDSLNFKLTTERD